MKKIMATAALAGLILAACNKKNVEPIEPIVPTGETQEFKYSKDIRVYDDSKTYYMDLNISSNNKDEFEANIKGLTNSKVIMVNDIPKNSNNTLSTKQLPPSGKKPTDLNFVKMDNLLTINKIFKGANKAAKLESNQKDMKNESQKTDFVVSGSSTLLYFHIGVCNYYSIYAENKTMFVEDYYRDFYTGYHLIQNKYVNLHTTEYFNLGSGDRYATLQSASGGYWYINMIVY